MNACNKVIINDFITKPPKNYLVDIYSYNMGQAFSYEVLVLWLITLRCYFQNNSLVLTSLCVQGFHNVRGVLPV